MSKVIGYEIGGELVKALNLRSDATSITITIKGDELVEVATTHDMDVGEDDELVSILSKYNLIPKE